MMLASSTRSLPKATYVTLRPDSSRNTEFGRAVLKSGFVRQLSLQPGEVDAVVRQNRQRTALLDGKEHTLSHESDIAQLLQRVAAAQTPSDVPSPAEFASVPTSQFVVFGRLLSDLRRSNLTQAQSDDKGSHGTMHLESLGVSGTDLANQIDIGHIINQINSAATATSTFTSNITAAPIGMLNLERLDMTPAGLEKGELLATVPLAPMEKTTVVQQEWSVVSQEFTSIVTDELENFSEKGVTENTELAQATTSQNAHSNQFNITASASGGCGFVSGSVSSGLQSQDQHSQSATDSRKHAQTTTQKASSRVKQSRKVTISSSTISGSSLTTTRTLENPSSVTPMRVDYFSMMRKWHLGLYRYGLRLTYDLTVPEPGAALRAAYKELAQLNEKAAASFTFPVEYTEIDPNTPKSYQDLVRKYGAEMPAAPKRAVDTQRVGGAVEHTGTEGTSILGVNTLNFEIREGYEIDSVDLELELGNITQNRRFDVQGCETVTWLFPSNGAQLDDQQKHTFTTLLGSGGAPFMQGELGTSSISYVIGNTNVGTATFVLHLKLTAEYLDSWTVSVWNQLYNAAQTAFYTQQSKVQEQISTLQDRINNVDTLTLRREENEEIMKCALRWLLGPHFEFVPDSVIQYFQASASATAGGAPGAKQKNHLKWGVNFTGNSLGLSTQDWTVISRYESVVNFINEAIEWENVIYFLYSYFWDVPEAWSFVRQLQHPDATRQAFLRAGASRVVLTVRKGYETAWTWFADQFDFNAPGGPWPDYPYMTIAQEIQNYDDTNYPGIPPANPSDGSGGGGPSDGTPAAGTTCSAHIQPSTSSTDLAVTIPVADSTGFRPGASAVIDFWDARKPDGVTSLQERQTIVAVRDTTHIVVERLNDEHNGNADGRGPFPVLQAASKGLLIAEWFEYTPSQGTYIDINSDLTTIA